jgi:hypothetical protein
MVLDESVASKECMSAGLKYDSGGQKMPAVIQRNNRLTRNSTRVAINFIKPVLD